MDFFQLITPEKAGQIIRTSFSPSSGCDAVAISEADSRYAFRDYRAGENIPGFRRSQVDGYAVRAADTFGAGESLASYLTVQGTLNVHENASHLSVQPEGCYRISTGGMLPREADAVVMVEYTRSAEGNTVEITRPVSPWENVIDADEDLKKGEVVLERGQRITPFHTGVLASLGYHQIEVFSAITTSVICTGDELVGAAQKPPPGKIRDVNSSTLSGLLKAWGASPRFMGIVKDDLHSLKKALEMGIRNNSLVLLSGGSSVGTRDLSVDAIKSFPGFEILFHGLGLKPGKPTLLAKISGKPVVGLPGQVLSSVVSFFRVVAPIIKNCYACSDPLKTLMVEAAQNIPGTEGRENWIRAKIANRGSRSLVYPIYGKSGVLKSCLHSDGFIIVPGDSEGVHAGEYCHFTPMEYLF
ncbi:MAG: molybdopterin molybdotransferase MoeA [Spirochaetota bacterium]